MKNKDEFQKMNCKGCQCDECFECASANCDVCYRAEFATEDLDDMYIEGSGGIDNCIDQDLP